MMHRTASLPASCSVEQGLSNIGSAGDIVSMWPKNKKVGRQPVPPACTHGLAPYMRLTMSSKLHQPIQAQLPWTQHLTHSGKATCVAKGTLRYNSAKQKGRSPIRRSINALAVSRRDQTQRATFGMVARL